MRRHRTVGPHALLETALLQRQPLIGRRPASQPGGTTRVEHARGVLQHARPHGRRAGANLRSCFRSG